jgi:hypothetical protein
MSAILEVPSVVTVSSISPACLEIVKIGRDHLVFRNAPWGVTWRKVFSARDKRSGDQVVLGKKHGDDGEHRVHVSALMQTLSNSGGLPGKDFAANLSSLLG